MTCPKGTVLHLIDTIGPGGAETVFLQTAHGLGERGWAARTVLVGPGWVLDRALRLRLRVQLIPTNGRFDLGYLRGLRDLVREHDVRLIHAHLFSPSLYASVVGAWAGIPVVATFHGASDTQGGGWGRELRMRLINRGASIVCVSESLRDGIVGRFGVDSPDVRVIHNGVDVARYGNGNRAAVRLEHGIPDDTVLVGALGNIREAKDFPTFLEAAAILAPDKRLAFAIVGEPKEPLYGQLIELRNHLGLEDRVSFWGFREDVPGVMAAFDILAISSTTEGFSLAAIQAMAAGTPVVATRSGGPERIVTHEEDGLLVPPSSPHSLARAIQRMADEPGLSERLAIQARRTVEERFSLGAMLDAYEALYRSLVGYRKVLRDRSHGVEPHVVPP